MTFNVEVPKCSSLLGTPIKVGGLTIGTVVSYTVTDRPSSQVGMEIVEVMVELNEPVPNTLKESIK